MSGSTIKAEATLSKRVALFFLSPVFPWFAGLVATLIVATSIDLAGDINESTQGPGLTFDEVFNIEVGVYLARSFSEAGVSSFHPDTLQEIYENPAYNPDHPPLGRIAMGATHEALNHYFPSEGDRPFVVSYARIASAIEFGLLVFLIAVYSRRWYGPLASCAAAISLICMPRLFGHAHLASLETCTALTYTAFVLTIADRWWWSDRIRIGKTIYPGVLLGLVFLTKIHAILLLPVILVWGLWNWGFRVLVPIFFLLTTAFAVFFLGWPWLWSDPVQHLIEYFSRATERSSLNCFYFFEKFADRDVPWHYPFVMFAVTMPLGFLVAGLIGMINRTGDENSRRALADRRTQLIFGAWLMPLAVFAIPGVTVYDGVRLFLMSFPLFAIFVGLGAMRIFESTQRRNGEFVSALLVVASLTGPIYNIITLHPCQLSYYSEAVAGLWKADELGFEITYWGDSVSPDFLTRGLRELPEGATLEIAPVLHPLQLEFMRQHSGLRRRPDLVLKAYDDQRDDLSPYVLVIRRKADPWDSLSPPPPGTKRLAVEEKQGVILTELLQLPDRRGQESPGD